MRVIIVVQLPVSIGEGLALESGIFIGQDGLGQKFFEQGFGHVPAVDHTEIGFLRAGIALHTVGVQRVHVVLNGLFALCRERVSRSFCLTAQDGHLLELVQSLLQEVVGVGGPFLLVVGLLRGGQGGVIAHIHPHLLIGLRLLGEPVGDGVIVVGDLRGGVCLVAHSGSGRVGVLLPEEEGVPDQKRGDQNGNDDANGPVELGLFAHGLFLSLGLVHNVCVILLVSADKKSLQTRIILNIGNVCKGKRQDSHFCA